MDKSNYTHLLYVRKYSIIANDYKVYVYGVNTRDIFHTMGEIYYRTFEHIERITPRKLAPENRQAIFDFLEERGEKIYDWFDKYTEDEK